MDALNIADIFILIIFLFSMIVGFARGLVSEIISLGTLLLAFTIAIMFSERLAEYASASSMVRSAVTQTTSASGIDTAQPISYMVIGLSFAFLFVCTLIAGFFVKIFLNLFVQSGILGTANRVMGAVFGLIRGFIINLVLIFLIQLSPASANAVIQRSALIPKFAPAVNWLNGLVSPTLANLRAKTSSVIEGVSNKVSGVGQ